MIPLPISVENPEYQSSIASYLAGFPYRITVNFGKVYSTEFKEFNTWCEQTLGIKYKDWFLVSRAKGYTLYLKDNKKSMFIALKYSDSIDSTTL